ncbi:MAG TPA: mannosyltransferase, partial [Ferruginibacter sp.]|nr:mannosyltransferase [Ferruginibacter sp.]
MQDMIAKAHIHILPSLNNTGVKLKLLNALFNGRFCLVNQAAIAGTELEPYCHLAGSATAFQQKIQELYETGFTEEETHRRQGLLQTVYNNEVNAQRLITFLS